jgi:hypothetical protein
MVEGGQGCRCRSRGRSKVNLGADAHRLRDENVTQDQHLPPHLTPRQKEGNETNPRKPKVRPHRGRRNRRPDAAARLRGAKVFGEKIAALAAVHLIPKVGEMIEMADMRKTNAYGEAKTPSMTFKEYIAHRAEEYMSEAVNIRGLSKAEDGSYQWQSAGPRLTVLMRNYIRETLEKHAKAAITDVNKAIAKNIETAARDAINAAASSLKVAVSA